MASGHRDLRIVRHRWRRQSRYGGRVIVGHAGTATHRAHSRAGDRRRCVTISSDALRGKRQQGSSGRPGLVQDRGQASSGNAEVAADYTDPDAFGRAARRIGHHPSPGDQRSLRSSPVDGTDAGWTVLAILGPSGVDKSVAAQAIA